MVEKEIANYHHFNEDTAIRNILEGTAAETGEGFFQALVKNLALSLNTSGALITEYRKEKQRLVALAFWMDNKFVENYEYDIKGTPCESVIYEKKFVHYPEKVIELFPGDNDLGRFHAESYMGAPLMADDGRVYGNLVVVDSYPMPPRERTFSLFRIFAARAMAEVKRIHAEKEIKKREERLNRLIDSTMDAFIELDQDLKIKRLNPAAVKMFCCEEIQARNSPLAQFLPETSRRHIFNLISELQSRPAGEKYLWVAGGLEIVTAGGDRFQAEASLSQYQMDNQAFYSLILRNLNEKLEAERKIRSLTVQAEYLQEEIKEYHNYDFIIGRSQALLEALRKVKQVAQTDATVLISGETGTGKELFAMAIHGSSNRQNKPLIKVNCAAIPATLMESEFFGHEQGAFTGATQNRDGRFLLADGGTIFLDEIGELPLDLQSKLLRILQEGEFEPVGSSKTRKVDVRVIAATNRDLSAEVKAGRFREDLYYRLNVFPIEIPSLRERLDDIPLLANEFANNYALRIGRTIPPLSQDFLDSLKSYDWPGNVRELRNVMERAVIASGEGQLIAPRALAGISSNSQPAKSAATTSSEKILSIDEMQELERENIIRALGKAGWKVSGKGGAAEILKINASTLSSRIKVLGIKRSR